jgi:uncharacterized protein (DUF58 family)
MRISLRRAAPGARPARSESSERPPLLDAGDLRRLERLSILSLQTVLEGVSGQRPQGARLAGLEFADFRPYVPGDDLRYVDWNIRARLGELLVKVAPDERRARFDVLIDMSRSMDFGLHNKLWHARRLAVMLGAVALLHSDTVRVYGLGGREVQAGGLLDAPSMVGALGREVGSLRSAGPTELPAAVRAYGRVRGRADLVVLISDGLVPAPAFREALNDLAAQATSIAFLHVIDPSELRPPPSRGQLELRDSETEGVLELTLGAGSLATYTELLEQFREGVERSVRAVGGRYLLAPTEVEPLDLLSAGARREGLVLA